MTNHTPGPWAIDEIDGVIYHADGDVNPAIAYIERENTSENQWKADARLVASAPALLEALENFVYQTQGHAEPSVMQWELIQMSAKRARLAIDAAKGQAA